MSTSANVAPSQPRRYDDRQERVSRWATQLDTHSYLVFFAIWGTLSRLGLQALTHYPGAPVSFGVLWANIGGSFIFGFLAEDTKLFYSPVDDPVDEQEMPSRETYAAPKPELASMSASARKTHMARKKAIPLYVGLTTGFCGSFTSFSSFIRDMFLATSNDLPSPDLSTPLSRHGGYSFMALLAVLITTLGLSLSALIVGNHAANALHPCTPSPPPGFTRRYLNPLSILLGWGSWLGAILLAVFPPYKHWRGQALFAVVFAPLGCIVRYHLSLLLNPRNPAFPIGTFSANILGTVILGMGWDLLHVPLGGLVGCQVLLGIDDGFCGCLTTVSTWVAELASLRRRHAYIYGSVSVVSAFALMVAIMGGMRWSIGFQPPMCKN
ncbi:hypothetical protein D7B24_003802 [Verticillium nonalfalfae]|uniref:Fluoride export protein 1 n=1 Tax=Verticillium nonalfalfae TaxID=1051616 RepID=A0A3M9YGC9_9PEZI|nr:uncharacterized protein D7B24_003802 [Verticillium nonalfalfae]RNJ58982.1 hypothetical protein D7B24_003802 [Verticillium nonalfalfae]